MTIGNNGMFLRQCALLSSLTVLAVACAQREPKQSDLPQQPDRWINSVALDEDSRVQFIGKTRDYVITSVTKVEKVDAPHLISVGDNVEGIQVGAIQCSYHTRDASYGGEQFMWRGRWSCKAGRSKREVETSVGSDGQKHFAYLFINPVNLRIE
jgi:hypothetical protein